MRYKLTIEYDGSRYAGWQLQKNDRSVQGELLAAAAKVFGSQVIELYGSGRTDSGVHARGQVAHMDVPDDRGLLPEQVLTQFNAELPHDLNLLRVEKVSAKFHARHDARLRTYVYQVSRRRDAFAKRFVWWVRDPLDLAQMRAAGALMVGFHDFRAFGDTEVAGQSTMVDLSRVEIVEDGDRILIYVAGSHFLWKMVRRLVGVLVEVGKGKMPADAVATYLKAPFPRDPARLTAPPSGLFLERVDY